MTNVEKTLKSDYVMVPLTLRSSFLLFDLIFFLFSFYLFIKLVIIYCYFLLCVFFSPLVAHVKENKGVN